MKILIEMKIEPLRHPIYQQIINIHGIEFKNQFKKKVKVN